MEKRRKLKADSDVKNRIGYAELCKTIRKNIKADIRKFNMEAVEQAIAKGKSLKKTRRHLEIGNQKITCLIDKNGKEIKNQDDILKRIHEFYEDLYSSDQEMDVPDGPHEDVQAVTHWEINFCATPNETRKAPGPDGVLVDSLKEGGDITTRELAKPFTKCIKVKKGTISMKKSKHDNPFKKRQRQGPDKLQTH